jgi:hypothetical protein
MPLLSPNSAAGIFAFSAITRLKQALRDNGTSNRYLYLGTLTLGYAKLNVEEKVLPVAHLAAG